MAIELRWPMKSPQALVSLALHVISILICITAFGVGLFPLTARQGLAKFVDTAAVEKTRVHEDGEGGIRGVEQWEEMVYRVAIVDRNGRSLGVVASSRVPRPSDGEEVRYSPFSLRLFVFEANYDGRAYFYRAGFLLLASVLIFIAAKWVMKNGSGDSVTNQSSELTSGAEE
jgi:hypothetical protein